jgi:hypothetical protein
MTNPVEGPRAPEAPKPAGTDPAHPLAFHKVVGNGQLPHDYKGPPVDLPDVMFKDYVRAVHRSDPKERWDREQKFEDRLRQLKETNPSLYDTVKGIGKMIEQGKSPDAVGNAIGTMLKSAWQNAHSIDDLKDVSRLASGLLLSTEGSFKGSPDQIQKRTEALLNGTEAAINPDPDHPGKPLPPGTDPNKLFHLNIPTADGGANAWLPHASLLDDKGFPVQPGSKRSGPPPEPGMRIDIAPITVTPKKDAI